MAQIININQYQSTESLRLSTLEEEIASLQYKLTTLISEKSNLNKKLIIKNDGESIGYAISDILFIEADSNYSTIVLINGKRHLTSKTLKLWEKKLASNDLIRVHASYLVNKNHIHGISQGHITMSDECTIPISRRKWILIKNIIKL